VPATDGDSAVLACVELGDFDAGSLARIEPRLAQFALGDRLRAMRVDGSKWFGVYLPATGTPADVERVVQALRDRGVGDAVVTTEGSALPSAILLGAFRDRELAQRQQADLARRGLRGVQLAERAVEGPATRLQISGADVALMRELTEIQKDFPFSQLGACGN
jgi:hypothetical protein